MDNGIFRIWLAGALLALAAASTGCGGHGSGALGAAAPAIDAATDATAMPQQPPTGVDLPSLSELPQPLRKTSVLGPGWMPLEQAAILASSGLMLGTGEKISLSGSPDFAYAVYAIYGFDGDNGPTSARVTSTAVSGNYYVAFSDYQDHSWLYAGPYNFASGGGTTEITIPNTGGFVSPSAFIAPYLSATYVAVIVPKDETLADTTLELGVHGGMTGPRPPLTMVAHGGLSGMTVRWLHSPDVVKPDFAGYAIERAPQFGGAFAPVGSGLHEGDFAFDDTAELDTFYRYRIAAQDVSGNRSLWIEYLGARLTAGYQPPVPIIQGLPETTMYGPVELSLDMSDSYDPGGAAITNYNLMDASGKVLYDGAGYAFNLTLHPGCYFLRFTVTANGKDGTTYRYLKVLPRWRTNAVMLSNPQTQNVFPRLTALGLAELPGGKFCLGGYDPFIPAFSVRTLQFGAAPELYTFPLYNGISFHSEPVVLNDDVYYAISDSLHFRVLCFNGERIDEQYSYSFSTTQANPRVALAGDGASRLWSVFCEDDMGLALYAVRIGPYAPAVLVDPLPTLQALDAAYDPAADALWVVYSANSETRWLKLNPDTLAIMDDGQLTGFASVTIDVEFDPVNQIPGVAFHSLGKTYYSYNDGFWHLWEEVDPSGGNSTALDLEFLDGKPRVFTSDVGAQASVYTRDTVNTWTARDVAYSSTSGVRVALAAFTDDDGPAYFVADSAINRHSTGARLNGDGSENVMMDIWPTTGQGIQMHGVGGADGLHVVFDQIQGGMMHLVGNADGQSWLGKPVPAGAAQPDMTALADGTVYLSYFSGANANLDRWDGAAWVNVSAQPSQITYRPFLAHGRPREFVSWVCADDTALSWTAVQGDHVNGYDTLTKPFAGELAWNGTAVIISTMNPVGSSTAYFTLSGLQGFPYNSANLNEFEGLEAPGERILYTLRGYEDLYDQYIFGRNLVCAEYSGLNASAGGLALWIGSGTNVPAARYTPDMTLAERINELPTNTTAPGYDMRRTVSAMTAGSLTAVALVCDLSGNDQYMEWSNFGNWERLPLPPLDDAYRSNLHMNQPQLFVGMDGRWHMVYRGYDTDAIFIRSTL